MKHYDTFEGWTDEEIQTFMDEQRLQHWRKLPDGEVVCLQPLMFTLSVCCGVTPHTMYKYRWCFEDPKEAVHFFKTIQEYDEVPERKTSLKGHRYLTAPLYMEIDQHGFRKW